MTDFAHTHARTTDPHTSHKAAAAAKGLAGAHRDLIIGWLGSLSMNDDGRTIEEIAAGVGLTHVQVARRMSELEADGRATWSGERLLSSGRNGRVWYSLACSSAA